MAKPIQAIIFDCFGVLATDGWLPFRQEYFGNNPELLERAIMLNKRVDAGLADYDEFIREVARMAGLQEAVARRQIENNVPNEPLLAYIESELRPVFKIGLLSNAGDNWLEQIFDTAHLELFEAIALSYETGFVKPDHRAYEVIAERLHVPIETCVFIDDQERYCTAAREAGMLRGILYKGFEQMKRELEQLLATNT